MPSPRPKTPPALAIALIKMGRISQTALRVIAANIQAVMAVPVDVLPEMTIPAEAWQRHRDQYDAGLILKHLAGSSFPKHARVLAVTDVDLCTPILTFVFGEAELGLSLAIVSDFRLKHVDEGPRAAEGVYYERLAKVALHELAHTFALYHCEAPGCLMQYSPSLCHLDGLDIVLCERCSFMLGQTLKNLQP
jgi:archaemetzincin